MNNNKSKKALKRQSRKTVFGIKLPPIEPCEGADVRTVLDIDPHYYALVDGRPIRSNNSINKYKQDIKEIALKRTLYGFLSDEILRIDREIETERNIYETASKHFEEYQNSFDKFLAHDNNKTITIMQRSDMLAKELTNKNEEHKQNYYEMTSLKSKLQYVDESLLILLSFQNFLYTTAPILWQQKENIELDVKHQEIFTMDTDIFKKIDIDQIKERLDKWPTPKLYFETPEQLLTIFDLLEKQNTDYLLITEELNCEKNKFLKAVGLLKKLLQQELDFIQQKIKETEYVITWNTIREDEIKEVFYRILEDKLKYLVSSEKVLQIYNYVGYTYEQLLAPNNINLSSIAMIHAIKTDYEDLMMDLSALNLDIVKQVEKEIFEDAAKEIKLSKEANRLLKDVNKLNKRLKSSYEPSRKQ